LARFVRNAKLDKEFVTTEGTLSPATTALRRYEVGDVKKGIAGGKGETALVRCGVVGERELPS
jgi:hypothetical protein